MTTQTNGAPPPLAIPRITPPQGERTPLHAHPVEVLPLEPSVVPNPPMASSDIPRPKPKAPAALEPPKPPAYVLPDAVYPQTEVASVEQVLWCLARFQVEGPGGVRETWEAAIGPGPFAAALAQFNKETTAYAAALEAYEKAKAAPPAQPMPSPAPAVVAPPVSAVPQPEAPPAVSAALQQPGALALGAYWAINGTPAQITRFGAACHNPLDQEVFLRTEAGNEHVTQVKFLASSTSGWTFLRPPAQPEPDAAALAAVHHDAPAMQGSTPTPPPAPAQPGEGTKRRLGAQAKARCLELHAEGKTKHEIAQATGLPMELVDRALAGAPSPAVQAAAAERAYQQSLAAGSSEEQARAASTHAIGQAFRTAATGVIADAIATDQAAMTPDATLPAGVNKRLLAACIVASSLEQGLSAYKGAGNYLDQLKVMRDELEFLIAQIEGES